MTKIDHDTAVLLNEIGFCVADWREGDEVDVAEIVAEWSRTAEALAKAGRDAEDQYKRAATATARAEAAEARVTELERILGNWMFINGALTTAIEALREGDFKRHLWNDFSQVLDDTMRALRAQEPSDD